MPSIQIHIAVGKKYCEINKLNFTLDFYKGVVEPDLLGENSHYSGLRDKNDILEYLKNKVNLISYLNKNNILDEYHKGYFLHLVTDYLFFNYYFSKKYLEDIGYEKFCKNLYFSYDVVNDYLIEKYKIDYLLYKNDIMQDIEKSKSEKNMDDKQYQNILSQDKLERFIENVGKINLENYVIKLKKAGKNVLPDELEEE